MLPRRSFPYWFCRALDEANRELEALRLRVAALEASDDNARAETVAAHAHGEALLSDRASLIEEVEMLRKHLAAMNKVGRSLSPP